LEEATLLMLPGTTKSSNDFGFDDSDSLALWERVRERASL
jgi:hypothetical protein